ncbi:putative C6 transcription factor [Aspergillus granulosus]|uniref:C6 transcription factor n=1 Tax=Aspergillus granulosus TaxID=176169 RepID=A0ABR4HMI9_9EURO
MTPRQSSPDSTNNVRKRVCKACDRCRLKKSKCDIGNPCGRCRADNAICVFGRQKAQNKVYPKGFVEMLEQQQTWLVAGLQELYHRTCDGQGWSGDQLKCEANGRPLTHDLLVHLGALDQSKGECFEENPEVMQHKLWKQNAPDPTQQQESSDASSDSAYSPTVPARFVDLFAQLMPPNPPNRSSSTFFKLEHGLSAPFAGPQLAIQGVVNPMVLQAPPPPPPRQHLSETVFGRFEDGEIMGSMDFGNVLFEDTVTSPMFHPLTINCMSYTNPKSDYEDLNQFVNANSPEIALT